MQVLKRQLGISWTDQHLTLPTQHTINSTIHGTSMDDEDEDRNKLLCNIVLGGMVLAVLANVVLSNMGYTVTERIFWVTVVLGRIYGALLYNAPFSSEFGVCTLIMALQFLLLPPVYLILWIEWGFQHTGFALGLVCSLILQPLIPLTFKRLYDCYLVSRRWIRQVPGRISRLFKSPRRHEDEGFLRLPPELRLKVYSHLLSSNQPSSVSRSLRQTCRLINEEVEHEQRKEFERQIKALQLQEEHKLLTVSCNSDTYHVDMVFSLNRVHGPQTWEEHLYRLERFDRYTNNGYIMDFLQAVPAMTRSVKITIELPPRVSSKIPYGFFKYSERDLRAYLGFMRVDTLYRPLRGMSNADDPYLHSTSLVYAPPVILIPVLRHPYFTCELHGIKLAGVVQEFDKVIPRGMQSRDMLRMDQKFLFLKRAVLALLPYLGDVDYMLKYE
jgi:hypothetical protein